MKSKRKAKEGVWRIVPGNHPNDHVVVEIPANGLGIRDRRRGTVHPENKPEQPPNIAERLLDELASARARNDDLTDKLIAAKDVLSTAYDKLISLNQGTGIGADRSNCSERRSDRGQGSSIAITRNWRLISSLK